jgi:hypothetical protein
MDPGSGSAIRKNAGSGSVSGSALNQCGSETLLHALQNFILGCSAPSGIYRCVVTIRQRVAVFTTTVAAPQRELGTSIQPLKIPTAQLQNKSDNKSYRRDFSINQKEDDTCQLFGT